MKPEYSHEDQKVKPTRLGAATLMYVGRITRAFAEIDDLITRRIATLMGISLGETVLMLGPTRIRKKIDIAENLAKRRSPAEHEKHAAAFPPYLFQLMSVRNKLAHGALLGEDEDGKLTFLSSDVGDVSDETVKLVTYGFTRAQLGDWASDAEKFVPAIEAIFELSASRQKHLQEGLRAHPKGRKPKSLKRKRGDPPQPSEA